MFSRDFPSLRLQWDSTSINAFQKDPVEYYYRYVEGWTEPEPNINLVWGTCWDACTKRYHNTNSCKEAVELAIDLANEHDLDQVAAESNKANKKNLATLIRSVVWYDEWFVEMEPYKPLPLEKDKYKIELPITAPTGEPYYMIVNFDQLAEDEYLNKIVVERKSTTTTLSPHYFQQYDPSVQINTYDWAAAELFGTSGLMVEAVQTAVGFSRFDTHTVWRNNAQREHWLNCLIYTIKQAEKLAISGAWHDAMNLGTQRWESFYRNMERKPQAMWEGMLNVELEKRSPWNPMEDI